MTRFYVNKERAEAYGLAIDDHRLILCSPTMTSGYQTFNLSDYVLSGYLTYAGETEGSALHRWLLQLVARLNSTHPTPEIPVVVSTPKTSRQPMVYNVTSQLMDDRSNWLVCEPMDLFEVILLFPDSVLLSANVITFTHDNDYWIVTRSSDETMTTIRAKSPDSLWKNPPEPRTVEKVVEKIVEVEKPVEVKATRRRRNNQKTLPEVVEVEPEVPVIQA